jgi:hypothetical protein
MTHCIQLHTEVEPHKAVLKWDVMNAFGEFDRDDGFDVLEDNFPDSLNLVANCYSDPSVSSFRSEDGTPIHVNMTTGSTQGDVYGGLLFCSAFSKPLRKTIKKFADKGLRMYAYYDDVYVVIDPRYVNALTEYFQAQLKQHKLQMRPSATSIYIPNQTTIVSRIQFYQTFKKGTTED